MKLHSLRNNYSKISFWFLSLFFACCLIFEPASLQARDVLFSKGKKIYFKQCASCHGSKGEGVKDRYDDPLIGDLSKNDLAKLISETMPEEDPEDCIGKNASAVAHYILKEFYSPAAQSRLHPIRVEVSRLTVRQFRVSIADLLSDPQGKAILSDQRGLKAEYFYTRNFKQSKIPGRVDPSINYDYGEESPDKNLRKEEFSIRWKGSLIAPETGEYEIVMKTPNGVKLWLNDNSKPLIDGWVASGMRELKTTIFLLGGRSYPLRLDYFKYKEKLSSIKLMWKLPGQAKQVIPSRYLIPENSPETVVVSRKFPPDDQSEGYIRGNSVSKEWLQAVTYSAVDIADFVSQRMNRFVKAKPEDKDYKEKVKSRFVQFVERAFSMKLNDAAKKHFIYQYIDQSDDLKLAVRKIIIHTIESPYFLYRFVGKKGDSSEIASRISLVLWDSIPDKELLKVVLDGSLKKPEVLEKQIDRMVRDPKATAKIHAFMLDWLNVERFKGLSKDKKRFPKFNDQLVSDLRISLNLSISETIEKEKADFRDLFLSPDLYLNDNLAAFYQIKNDANNDFVKVSVNPAERAGIISHPYVMAGYAYHSTSSPIHRGVFLAKTVFGRRLRPPKEAITPLAPDLHPDLTTRERIKFQTAPQACVKCHELINPLGFPLENFDAVGRYQVKEKGQPIDSSGSYESLAGKIVYFDGVRELAEYLAESSEVHSAFVEKLFRYSVKQPVLAFGHSQQMKLVKSFVTNEYDIRDLLKEIAKVSVRGQKKR